MLVQGAGLMHKCTSLNELVGNIKHQENTDQKHYPYHKLQQFLPLKITTHTINTFASQLNQVTIQEIV